MMDRNTAYALLNARRGVLEAEQSLRDAQEYYRAAEDAFFVGARHEDDPGSAKGNFVIDGTLIMPEEDWFDCKRGQRLRFYKVETL